MSTFESTPSKSNGMNDRSFMADPYIGFVLDEQYRIVSLIGAGGWGNVYKAEHVETGAILAVKIVHKHHLQDDQNMRRFDLEARLLMKLQSEFIVKIIDHGSTPAPYIVMEYFTGEPLSKWIKTNGPMPPQVAVELFLQLCDGLSAAQSMRIVHRDLKPANILLRMNAGEARGKILDFGLAKFVDQSSGGDKLTSTGDVLGSPPYMSPEQWKSQCDHRSDIYSLGCIMYEVLTGRPAFTADYGLDYLNKHLSEKPKTFAEVFEGEKLPSTLAALEDVVNKCMQKAPENRYQSAAQCKSDLRKVKQGRKPMIILAEDKKTVNTKKFLVSGVVAATVIGAGFLLKDPVIHAICAQMYSQADSKLSLGETDAAIAQYRQVLSLSQSLHENDTQKLHALRTLSALLREKKELTAAETLDREAEQIIGAASTNPELALLLHKINSNIHDDKTTEAENQCKEALALASAKLGQHSMGYAECLELMGTIKSKQGDFGQAVINYQQALTLAENFLEQNSVRKAAIMDELAAALRGAGNTIESDKYLALSMALKNQSKGETSETVRLPSVPVASATSTINSKKPVIEKVSEPAAVSASALPVVKPVVSPPVHRNPTPVASQPPPKPVTAKPNKLVAPTASHAAASANPHTAPSRPQSTSKGWGEMEKLRSFK